MPRDLLPFRSALRIHPNNPLRIQVGLDGQIEIHERAEEDHHHHHHHHPMMTTEGIRDEEIMNTATVEITITVDPMVVHPIHHNLQATMVGEMGTICHGGQEDIVAICDLVVLGIGQVVGPWNTPTMVGMEEERMNFDVPTIGVVIVLHHLVLVNIVAVGSTMIMTMVMMPSLKSWNGDYLY